MPTARRFESIAPHIRAILATVADAMTSGCNIEHLKAIEHDANVSLGQCIPIVKVTGDDVYDLTSIVTTFPYEYENKLKQLLRNSTWLFDTRSGEDDEYQCSAETFTRARGIILLLCSKACIVDDLFFFRPLPLPNIGCAGRGSIDLFWDLEDKKMLLNVHSNGETASYFGSRGKQTIEGKFNNANKHEHLDTIAGFLI